MNNILFARWRLPKLDSASIIEHVHNLPKSAWFYEPYRNTAMLPILTKGGQTGYSGTTNYKNDTFQWTQYASSSLMQWCQDVLFPALGMKTRIVILKTEAYKQNNEHIDCDPKHQFTRQHKFRIVLQGKTDTLYFIKRNGNVHVPNIEDAFIMDGSWPHGMSNNNSETKYTLTAGAPWTGLDVYNDLDILMTRNNEELPIDYQKYYKKHEN